ncbi:stress response protein [Micromonospora sp. C28ISP2-4]|uniref:stress response protein n=1 Tax=Micromonospora sp. C28ISP2-4 TaxID=3059523 RepID=UPI002676E5D3|nr:stress response protein [Micromonospora sp. C28ISP2-4]MDO3682620.1 stress response protein [Micromonospora sp. C28ISP2-4]
MSEETWLAARLIPTSGINGAEEQERRATSALLAVMSAVREFGRVLTQSVGAPAGVVQTFIEVPFKLGNQQLFPDGLIRVTRGQRQWTALVEVKTGSNPLRSEQLEAYLDIAREQGFDALITISNEIAPVPGQHPTTVDRRKLRKVALYHLPWTEILTQAVIQKEYRGVADPDQAWVLGELIRYLEHPRSGALEFSDMGPAWVQVRDGVSAGTLRAGDGAAAQVAGRFDALIRYACLRLGRRLGTDVTPALSRRDLADPAARTQSLANQLASAGTLTGSIRIPGAVGHLHVTADLRAGQIVCHVDVDAPRSGRPTTRVNWLVRQLKDAPDTVRIEAFVMHARGGGATDLLRQIRAEPTTLISDPSRELRAFRIAQSTTAGTKRGSGRGAFIDSVLHAIDDFYEQIIQNLKPWMPAPPRLRTSEDVIPVQPVASSLVSTAISSQDSPEFDTRETPGTPGSPDRSGE